MQVHSERYHDDWTGRVEAKVDSLALGAAPSALAERDEKLCKTYTRKGVTVDYSPAKTPSREVGKGGVGAGELSSLSKSPRSSLFFCGKSPNELYL